MVSGPGWGSGNQVDNYQTINGARHVYDPTQNYVNYGFGRVPLGDPIAALQAALDANAANVTPAPAPPQFKFTFDTIGQVIVRSIGNCRLLVKPIWAQGIVLSGDSSIKNTQTFAGAVCAPIDQAEEGEIGRIWDAGSLIFNAGTALTPPGWTDADAALLAASLASVVTFVGNESQLPAALIVADKGADKTNAFRGIRYFIFPNYPVKGSLPQLSLEFNRTNPQPPDGTAVEFLGGDT